MLEVVYSEVFTVRNIGYHSIKMRVVQVVQGTKLGGNTTDVRELLSNLRTETVLHFSSRNVGKLDACYLVSSQELKGSIVCCSNGKDELGLTNLDEMHIENTTSKPIVYLLYRLSFFQRNADTQEA